MSFGEKIWSAGVHQISAMLISCWSWPTVTDRRVYTVREIETMRRAVRCLAEMGPYWHGRKVTGAVAGKITSLDIESQLNTYISQGMTPEELVAEADNVLADNIAARKEREARIQASKDAANGDE